jgi:hypothetical protein
LLGNNHIGINIGAIHRSSNALQNGKTFHRGLLVIN